MRPVRIFRHVAGEGPGYLSQYLDERDVPYELVCIDRADPVPQHLDDVAGLVFMGGPMSVNDPLPWIADELRLIRAAAAAQVPVLGHCLGGQLISKALGGRVGPNAVTEIGWHEVERVDNEHSREWLDGLPERFMAFHWHGETFSLPSGAAPILRSRHCPNQGFVLGNILALQCHIEMTEDLVMGWAGQAQDELVSSASVQTAAQMADDLAARVAELQRRAAVLYARWLRPIVGSPTAGGSG
jgi:GMP synthase-like glutamine amidotransferase